jgi:hypothetical protein
MSRFQSQVLKAAICSSTTLRGVGCRFLGGNIGVGDSAGAIALAIVARSTVGKKTFEICKSGGVPYGLTISKSAVAKLVSEIARLVFGDSWAYLFLADRTAHGLRT